MTSDRLKDYLANCFASFYEKEEFNMRSFVLLDGIVNVGLMIFQNG